MNESPIFRSFVLCASIVVILTGLKLSQTIVIPVLVAFFLAVLTSPFVSFLVRYKIPTGIAITIVVLSLVGFFYALGTLVASSTDQFLERLPIYETQLQTWFALLQKQFPWFINDLRATVDEFRPTESAIGLLGTFFSSLGSFLTAFVLILFTLLFTLFEAQSASDKLKLALGDDHSIKYIKRFSKLVQRYLLIKSLISLATGLLVFVLLWFLDVDYPILWGSLAFLMNFIPNIGSLIAAIPPILLATIQHGLTGFLATLIGFVGINMIVGNLIEPRLMGKTLNISPLVVFLSLIFWGWILGPIGMLLSIPLTVVVKIGLEVYPPTRWLAQMISQ